MRKITVRLKKRGEEESCHLVSTVSKRTCSPVRVQKLPRGASGPPSLAQDLLRPSSSEPFAENGLSHPCTPYEVCAGILSILQMRDCQRWGKQFGDNHTTSDWQGLCWIPPVRHQSPLPRALPISGSQPCRDLRVIWGAYGAGQRGGNSILPGPAGDHSNLSSPAVSRSKVTPSPFS